MNTSKRKVVAVFLAGGLLLGGTVGCAKRSIDKSETKSVEVPGTDGTLQKFCDGTILIYWTPALSGGDDDYEFIVYDGCDANGNIINGAGAIDVNPGSAPRTEDLQSGEEDD